MKLTLKWRQVMRVLGVDVTYALSPQAKGKVERPYHHSNNHQIHSTYW